MCYSYLEEEDITYWGMGSKIWKIKLRVGDLDENKMRTEVIDLFEKIICWRYEYRRFVEYGNNSEIIM